MNDELMEWLLANQPLLAERLRDERRDAARGWKAATEAEVTLAAIAKLPDSWRKDVAVSLGLVKMAVELKADELEALIKGDSK